METNQAGDRSNIAPGEQQKRCCFWPSAQWRNIHPGEEHVVAQRMAIRISRIRDRLNRVGNLPRVRAVGASPNVDVAAGIHEHDASIRT